MPEEFVRAKHNETGHVAALPKESLELGFHPGWEAVDGPVPDGPKAAVPRKAATKSADASSASKKEE